MIIRSFLFFCLGAAIGAMGIDVTFKEVKFNCSTDKKAWINPQLWCFQITYSGDTFADFVMALPDEYRSLPAEYFQAMSRGEDWRPNPDRFYMLVGGCGSTPERPGLCTFYKDGRVRAPDRDISAEQASVAAKARFCSVLGREHMEFCKS